MSENSSRKKEEEATVSENSSTKLRLRSSDGEEFEVEEAVATLSSTINHMVEDGCAGGTITLPNVNGATLAKVLRYCKKHAVAAAVDENLRAWDAAFVDVGQEVLLDLILAANYMEIESLLELVCSKVVDMIKGKTPEEIRKTFDIENDFTPEEEDAYREQHSWAFN